MSTQVDRHGGNGAAPEGAGGEAARERRAFLILFILAAAAELVAFAILCLQDRQDFLSFITTKDTGSYLQVAQGLLRKGSIPLGTFRTVGYPLFLSGCFLVGGQAYGYYVTIGVQLLLNLVFLRLFWAVLSRVAAGAPLGIRVAMGGVFWLAGMGMSLWVMSDFQAALAFGLFVYVLLLRRSWAWVAAGSMALALAVLTRPTLNAIGLLVPLLALLASRVTSRVPWSHVAAYMVAALLAAGFSHWQVARAANLKGVESFWSFTIGFTIYYHLERFDPDAGKSRAIFKDMIAQRAGRPYAEVTQADQDRIAQEIFMERFCQRPVRYLLSWAKSLLKYTLVPIENTVYLTASALGREDAYFKWIRPVMFALCLPLWVASLVPPRTRQKGWLAYYALMMVVAVYVLSLGSVFSGAGERYRFPVLLLMLPVAATNIHWAWQRVRARLGRGAYRGKPTQGVGGEA